MDWVVVMVLGVLLILLCWWCGLRLEYELWWRTASPHYVHWSGSNYEVLRWHLARRYHRCDKSPAKRRPRRAF